jgi:hypothetical protein
MRTEIGERLETCMMTVTSLDTVLGNMITDEGRITSFDREMKQNLSILTQDISHTLPTRMINRAVGSECRQMVSRLQLYIWMTLVTDENSAKNDADSHQDWQWMTRNTILHDNDHYPTLDSTTNRIADLKPDTDSHKWLQLTKTQLRATAY